MQSTRTAILSEYKGWSTRNPACLPPCHHGRRCTLGNGTTDCAQGSSPSCSPFNHSYHDGLGVLSSKSLLGCVSPTLRIRVQAEPCFFKLEIYRSWLWPENPGDMACRRPIYRCFVSQKPRNKNGIIRPVLLFLAWVLVPQATDVSLDTLSRLILKRSLKRLQHDSLAS